MDAKASSLILFLVAIDKEACSIKALELSSVLPTNEWTCHMDLTAWKQISCVRRNHISHFPIKYQGTANPVQQGWYSFCMAFYARWIFLTASLRIPPGDEWWEIHLSDGKPYKMHFLNKLLIMLNAFHENYVRWIYLTNCFQHGGKSESCEKPRSI